VNLAARGIPAEYYQEHTSDCSHDAFLVHVPSYLRRAAEIMAHDSVVRSAGESS
jgi:hypothetical protein